MRLWHETVQCDERLLQGVRSGGEGGGGWGWEGIPSSEELEERLYLQATCNFHYNSIEDSHCPTGLDEMADFCFYCYITGKKLLQ